MQIPRIPGLLYHSNQDSWSNPPRTPHNLGRQRWNKLLGKIRSILRKRLKTRLHACDPLPSRSVNPLRRARPTLREIDTGDDPIVILEMPEKLRGSFRYPSTLEESGRTSRMRPLVAGENATSKQVKPQSLLACMVWESRRRPEAWT